MQESHSNLNFEIILINDGSDDGSWEEIQEVSQLNSRIKALSFSKNSGKFQQLLRELSIVLVMLLLLCRLIYKIQ
jgi:glycosyltransferase involved in cell wall biosynthesis